jgi:competence protein ComFC
MFRLINYTIDFAFPKICLISELKIPESNSNPFILDEIINKLDIPTTQDIYMLKNNIHSNDIFAKYVTTGKNDVNKMLHYLKYKGFSKLGLFFGELISLELVKKYPDISKKYDFIIPVPLHLTKLRERGYNQSEYLAKGINKNLKIKYYSEIVDRIRYTKSQTSLPYTERISNIKDAFRVNKKFLDIIKRKRIILIDDVITTGSTINEVIKVLKEAKVSNIFAVTLSMAKPK